MIRYVDITAFVVSLLAIGAGVAMKDPAWALVVVGGIVLATVFASRLVRQRPPKQPGEIQK